MPELPEVETVRQGLLRHLIGRKIVGATVLRPDSIGFPSPAQFTRQIVGHTFNDISRRGKYLLFHLDKKGGMVVHLRMSGRLLIIPKPASRQSLDVRDSHIRVRLALDDGAELLFEDMRVFGRIWFIPGGKKFEDIVSGLSDLGPEPLEHLTGKHLHKLLQKKTQSIKTTLLDQSVVAGIGNIYADESLFHAGINPLRPSGQLSLAELNLLSDKIRLVLSSAIALGGSTLRNYTDSSGVNGSYQHKSWVYGRKDKPCRRCKTKIQRVKLNGRSTHFCPKCQPQKNS